MKNAPRLLLVTAVVVTVVLTGAWLTFRASGPNALREAPAHTEAGAKAAAVGEVWYFGTGPIDARPGHTVHFTRAEVLGIPDGMEVVEIRLHSSADPGGNVGALPEAMYRAHRPVHTDLPSPPVVGGVKRPYWEFVVGLKITRPGRFKTAGVRVSYREGRRNGHRDFPYAFYMNTA